MKRSYFKYLAVGAMLLALWLARDIKEPAQVQNVAGISIDPAQKGEYLFSLELARTEKGDAFTVTSELLSVRAASLSQALEQASLQNEYPLVLTHGSLVVIHPKLLNGEMGAVAEMLLEDWQGQGRAYITVADGSDAAKILAAGEGENLRSGQLSEQVERAGRAGKAEICPLQEFCSRYLRGDTLSLPLVAGQEKGYRISGSIQIRRAG